MQAHSCSTASIYQRNVLKRRRLSIVIIRSSFAGLTCTGATAFANRSSPANVASRLPARQFHALSTGNGKFQIRRVSSCLDPAFAASASTFAHWLGGTRVNTGCKRFCRSTSCPRPANTPRKLHLLLFGNIQSVALLAGRQAGCDKRTEC